MGMPGPQMVKRYGIEFKLTAVKMSETPEVPLSIPAAGPSDPRESHPMHNPQKIEEAVLALLGAFEFDHGRAWKRFDFGVMESLAEKGLISDPHGRAESVHLTPEGLKQAKALADKLFGP